MSDEKNKHLQTIRREEQLAAMILRGYTRREIIIWVREHSDWGVKDSTIDNLLRGARELICDENAADIKEAWHSSHSRLLGLVRRANEVYRGANDDRAKIEAMKMELAAEKEFCNLLGLHKQSEKHHAVSANVVNVNLLNMPPEKLREEAIRRLTEAEQYKALLDVPTASSPIEDDDDDEEIFDIT